ncbi:hydroxyacid dehydrogenase [Martelella soudanensis]|uniref:hydroxyacid dehydrogenase n=1 Tax=unclassified Martelella TaxID=2629616 RepID=UPI00211310AB|nr:MULTISPECIES: hydroxyacid dehydrogenase [unclassified Martelella]
MPRTVLVTRDRIHPDAVAMLGEAGFECLFSPPYATGEEVVRTASEARVDAIMVSQGRITREVIAASSALKVIVKHGSGVNNINLAAAEDLSIPVYRAVGANARSVAEHTIALILSLLKSLPQLDKATKSGEWMKSSFIGRDIKGARLALVGLGVIGREVATLAKGLGMEVSAFDPGCDAEARDTLGRDNITLVSAIEDMLGEADIVSLHCPLTSKTRHLVDRRFLAALKPEAVLINTARGGIVDEEALAEVLIAGEIAGAGIDSFEQEPPPASLSLWGAPNLIVSPHAAGLTPGAERAMATTAAQLIIDHLAGKTIPAEFHAKAAVLGGLQE